jgi:pyridoxine 5-phosphate synthase
MADDILLGVNIDHVATIRQARRTYEPDPVWAAALAQLGGADGITIHLREDRRHINDRDVEMLRKSVFAVKLNLEMSIADDIVAKALEVVPDQATLVPEKREEITTEGGLDVARDVKTYSWIVARLNEKGISVSMIIDAEKEQIDASKEVAAKSIELHTGNYANARGEGAIEGELARLKEGAEYAESIGLEVFAGHGLTYTNVGPIVEIPQIREANIGHSIISRAVLVGLERAVREMKELLKRK